MAIDYGNEWKKFRGKHGLCRINVGGKQVHVRQVMDNQIQEAVDNREKLMEEYVKKQITTDIIGADGGYHTVKLEVFGESRGTIPISKNAFNTWIRNRNKKGGK